MYQSNKSSFATVLEWIVLGVAVLSGFFALLPIIFSGIFNGGVVALAAFSAWEFALWFCLKKEGKRARIAARILGVVTILGVITALILSFFMIKQAYFEKPNKDSDKVVIVLGGSIVGDRPNMMLERRLKTAIKLHQDSVGKVTFIVSGGQGPDEDYPESYVMKKYLIEHGINPDDIYTEESSTDTRENIQYSKEVLDENSLSGEIVIVTDGFHQLRACHYARENGFVAKSVSCNTPIGLIPTFWIREYMAVIKQVIL